MSHTPGPWEVCEFSHHFTVATDKSGDYSKTLADVAYWSTPHDKQPNRQTAEANARLIAAAPELLEALKEIVVDLQFSEVEQHKNLVAHAWAVIAKAEGGQGVDTQQRIPDAYTPNSIKPCPHCGKPDSHPYGTRGYACDARPATE